MKCRRLHTAATWLVLLTSGPTFGQFRPAPFVGSVVSNASGEDETAAYWNPALLAGLVESRRRFVVTPSAVYREGGQRFESLRAPEGFASLTPGRLGFGVGFTPLRDDHETKYVGFGGFGVALAKREQWAEWAEGLRVGLGGEVSARELSEISVDSVRPGASYDFGSVRIALAGRYPFDTYKGGKGRYMLDLAFLKRLGNFDWGLRGFGSYLEVPDRTDWLAEFIGTLRPVAHARSSVVLGGGGTLETAEDSHLRIGADLRYRFELWCPGWALELFGTGLLMPVLNGWDLDGALAAGLRIITFEM